MIVPPHIIPSSLQRAFLGCKYYIYINEYIIGMGSKLTTTKVKPVSTENTTTSNKNLIIGIGVGFVVLTIVIVIIVLSIIGRNRHKTSTDLLELEYVPPEGIFTDWMPQMWCSADNQSETCQTSKPIGAKGGWQNKVVSNSAIDNCPTVNDYPLDLPPTVSSWLDGVNAGQNQCNHQSKYTEWLAAYKDTIASTPNTLPQNDPNFYFADGSSPDGYMTLKYPPVCPPDSNCFRVNKNWGSKGGGICPVAPTTDCADTQPRFNWILGTCIGTECAQYDTGDVLSKQYKNMGSRCVVNYIAGYNYDISDKKWKIARDSSFNTDGRHKAYDCLKAFGGLDPDSPNVADQPWLIPQPKLASNYYNGYYPHDAEGLGILATKRSTPGLSADGNSGAFMIVISLEDSFNQAFFTLNQNALTRLNGYSNWDNCWKNANGGENEMMESPFAVPNAGEQQNYSRVFPNNLNNVGRAYQCLKNPDNAGVGGFDYKFQWTGGMTTSNPLSQPSATPFVFVFVFDGIAQWNYRIPASSLKDNSLWPGLQRKTTSAVLPARPNRPPTAEVNTCMSGKDDYCMSCLPNCPFLDKDTATKGGCSTDNWCGNWLGLMSNTRQWQYKSDGDWEIPDESGNVSEPITIGVGVDKECYTPLPNIDPAIIKGETKTWEFVCDTPLGDTCGDCQKLQLNKSMFCPRMVSSIVNQPWGNQMGPSNQKEIGYVRACADMEKKNYTDKCFDYKS
jgi:hypothetical protein